VSCGDDAVASYYSCGRQCLTCSRVQKIGSHRKSCYQCILAVSAKKCQKNIKNQIYIHTHLKFFNVDLS